MCAEMLLGQCLFGDGFVMQIMSSVKVVNRKVVDNLLILLVQNFQDFRTTGVRVIDFIISLSGLAYVLDSAAMLCLFD